eukprot:Sspe_Gene.35704::Locus_17282_Transcript_1_1_Confidence_1.000_Length_2805::g.35704::m.35704/K06047/TTL; tubulin---tyrosine ligase
MPSANPPRHRRQNSDGANQRVAQPKPYRRRSYDDTWASRLSEMLANESAGNGRRQSCTHLPQKRNTVLSSLPTNLNLQCLEPSLGSSRRAITPRPYGGESAPASPTMRRSYRNHPLLDGPPSARTSNSRSTIDWNALLNWESRTSRSFSTMQKAKDPPTRNAPPKGRSSQKPRSAPAPVRSRSPTSAKPPPRPRSPCRTASSPRGKPAPSPRDDRSTSSSEVIGMKLHELPDLSEVSLAQRIPASPREMRRRAAVEARTETLRRSSSKRVGSREGSPKKNNSRSSSQSPRSTSHPRSASTSPVKRSEGSRSSSSLHHRPSPRIAPSSVSTARAPGPLAASLIPSQPNVPADRPLLESPTSPLLEPLPTQATKSEQRRYRVYVSPKAGSVYERVHDLLVQLPFWDSVSDTEQAKKEVAAARSVSGHLPTIDLLMEDRYVSDKIIERWHRRKRKPERRRSADPLTAEKKRAIAVNSYSGTKCITLKAAMVRTLRRIPSSGRWLPEGYVLNATRYGSDERREYRAACSHLRRTTANIWIAKPSHRNKGIGIRVFDDEEDLLDYIEYEGSEGGKPTQYIAQKYIERPFLITGRKFDLRVWVAVTPHFDIFVYREGVLRTASERFQLHNLDDELSHLTNHCIQEHGPNFGKFEEGNEMWYHQFQAYLDSLPPSQPGHGVSLYKDLLPQAHKIIADSLLASKKTLVGSGEAETEKLGCFQLFGFDFMVDRDMHLWLIEVNGSPASAEALLDNMMRDLIEVVIEPVFPAPSGSAYEHSDVNNFECIYTEADPDVYFQRPSSSDDDIYPKPRSPTEPPVTHARRGSRESLGISNHSFARRASSASLDVHSSFGRASVVKESPRSAREQEEQDARVHAIISQIESQGPKPDKLV